MGPRSRPMMMRMLASSSNSRFGSVRCGTLHWPRERLFVVCPDLKKFMHIRIIGGSDAGISAALRAREINRDADISVFLADDYPNYSICGLPFYLSGETPDWHSWRIARNSKESTYTVTLG
jgi:hypothetical protein